MKHSIVILLLALLASCVQNEPDFYEKLKASDSGVFRGINIKDGVKKIRETENSDYLEADQQVFLRYNYPFDESLPESGHYEIEYYLDGEDQLHEIIISAFITNKEHAHDLFDKLKEEFTNKYGEGKKNEEGYLVWQGKTENTNVLEIALIDDSKFSESTGYITLQINDFDY